MVFLKAGKLKCARLGSRAVVCPTRPGRRGSHTTTRELQTRTFERPGASNTTKIPREDPERGKKRTNLVAGEWKKKARNFGPPPFWVPPFGPPPFGPPPFGPPPFGPLLFLCLGLHPSGLHPSGPHTLRAPTFSGFGPPPFGPPLGLAPGLHEKTKQLRITKKQFKKPNNQHKKSKQNLNFGQSRFGQSRFLAKVGRITMAKVGFDRPT